MKERSIIFNSEMVNVILNGRKIQTRIPIKIKDGDYFNTNKIECGELENLGSFGFCSEEYDYQCPYGKVGDRLWVKETWTLGKWAVGEESDGRESDPFISQCPDENDLIYKADTLLSSNYYDDPMEPVKWKSSVHMPRFASRILLEITEVRVERIQDITGKDACKEGIEELLVFPRYAFEKLWDSLHKKPGFGWEENPWVWVVEFKETK